MKYEVIDNFLDEEYFNSLVDLFTQTVPGFRGYGLMPWYFFSNVLRPEDVEKHEKLVTQNKIFYEFNSVLYDQRSPTSPYYENMIPLLDKLDARCLIRIKANLYPNTEILQEHALHVDYHFPHSGALLSLNTCDGYTKFEDGTKIDSVANRVLLFDPSIEHCSTSTTNVPARFNIIINYIQEQYKDVQ